MSHRILNTSKPTLPPAPPPQLIHHPPQQPTAPKLGRRAAAVAVAIAASPALLGAVSPSARAQEAAAAAASAPCIDELPITAKAFLDVSIGGEPAGRITVGLFGDAAPAGAARFLSLATGVGYRRKEFVKVVPGYVQHAGVVSYPVIPAVTDRLAAEMEAARAGCVGGGAMNAAGAVSIVVRDPSLPPPKPKLVARGGRLKIEEEQVGVVPNGTEFVIATRDSPELDASALVVGRVVAGMDVVGRIAAVATVKDNTGSAYFKVAKLIGDKRAVVAERGFNRPYTKILVTNCGVLEQQ
ncbi:peptidyl-prolyl cis-trans isomerase CYP26-2, chloroplastic-like [Triticum urartu]|uniref:Peptidyl-prolyl cis-trans isomerase n=1 Tax=Triticum urartu TaxID=4572 RepID=A0A8R7PMT9_TRIUA|nr:peptidyl-prolyl cis-trans isomerase CYP26-2, chloroplastic-like [Triticum urartu]XP_048561174.1 peptidyl-prolyl cis-trans isomerase CYP26-2, chloroplastic-like [Triticum urartu]